MYPCACRCGCRVLTAEGTCTTCRPPHGVRKGGLVPVRPSPSLPPNDPAPKPLPPDTKGLVSSALESEALLTGVGEAFGRWVGLGPGVGGKAVLSAARTARLLNELRMLKGKTK